MLRRDWGRALTLTWVVWAQLGATESGLPQGPWLGDVPARVSRAYRQLDHPDISRRTAAQQKLVESRAHWLKKLPKDWDRENTLSPETRYRLYWVLRRVHRLEEFREELFTEPLESLRSSVRSIYSDVPLATEELLLEVLNSPISDRVRERALQLFASLPSFEFERVESLLADPSPILRRCLYDLVGAEPGRLRRLVREDLKREERQLEAVRAVRRHHLGDLNDRVSELWPTAGELLRSEIALTLSRDPQPRFTPIYCRAAASADYRVTSAALGALERVANSEDLAKLLWSGVGREYWDVELRLVRLVS